MGETRRDTLRAAARSTLAAMPSDVLATIGRHDGTATPAELDRYIDHWGRAVDQLAAMAEWDADALLDASGLHDLDGGERNDGRLLMFAALAATAAAHRADGIEA